MPIVYANDIVSVRNEGHIFTHLEELFELPKFIKIPRHLGFGLNTEIQLHVFVDASTKVFAATVYARILEKPEANDLDNGVTARGENQNHCIAVTLITAKARVFVLAKPFQLSVV